MPVLDAFGANTPVVGIDPRVHSGTVTKGFVGRLTGSTDTEKMGPCAPAVKNFFVEEVNGAALHFQDFTELPSLEPDTRFLVLMERFCVSTWLEPLCQIGC